MAESRVSITSPPDREELIAEIIIDDEQWAEINQEREQLSVEFYPRRDGKPWEFPLDEARALLDQAETRLVSRTKALVFFAERAWLRVNWTKEAKEESGDYLLDIEVASHGFRGHAGGHVERQDFRSFIADLIRLEQTRKGAARFLSAAGDFEVVIQSADSVGHLGVRGSLEFSTGTAPSHRLEFQFEFEPSQIEFAARQLAPPNNG